MSDLQKLGIELDYFYEDVQELIPNYSNSIMYPLHRLFLQLIDSNISLQGETTIINEIYQEIQDTQNEWRGILSENSNK